MVLLQAGDKFANPRSVVLCDRAVAVEEVVFKTDPRLAEMVLVKSSRLSVQPVRDTEWAIICDLGGVQS